MRNLSELLLGVIWVGLSLLGTDGVRMQGIYPPDNADVAPYPSRDCKYDHFEVRKGHHMFAGKEYSNMKRVRACQDMCLDKDECIGLDWEEKTKKCYILYKDSLKWGGPYESKTADHYKRCPPKKNRHQFDPYGKQASGAATPGTTATTAAPAAGAAANQVGASPAAAAGAGAAAATGAAAAATAATGAGAATAGVTTPRPAVTPTTATTPTTLSTTTTIPDSGCPFALESFPMMSHPFGKNITNGTMYNTIESCKNYCLIRPACKGVDFDSMTSTCYELRSVNSAMLMSNPTVTHFQKTTCSSPLRCYVHAATPVTSASIAIQTPGVSQVICNGMCFTREIMQQGVTTCERGCMPGTGLHVGCMVGMSGTAPTDLTTMTCLCDRERCNGLSAMASASLAAYYPLDGDLLDASGLGHHGMPVDPNNAIQYSVMDPAVNTSAVFTGSQCIKIPSLTDVEYGTINGNSISPQVSLTFWWKQLADGSNTREGIIGNSLESDPTSGAPNADNVASIRLITDMTEGQVEAGIRTVGSTNRANPEADVQDFRFMTAPVNEWNLACLTYDGRNIPAMGLRPTLTLNISTTASATPVSSDTANTDEGLISSVQKQPMVIGCAQNLPFTGFIDEVRIFMTTLMPEDCLALRAMNNIFS